MGRLRWRTLALLAGGAYLVCTAALFSLDLAGRLTPVVSPLLALPLLACAVAVVLLGRQVRRLVRRERTRLEHSDAVRVLLLAQAAMMVATLTIGYLLAQLSVALTNIAAPYPQAQAWGSLAGLAAAGLLLGAGYVVEGWCVLDDDEDGPDTPSSGQGAAA